MSRTFDELLNMLFRYEEYSKMKDQLFSKEQNERTGKIVRQHRIMKNYGLREFAKILGMTQSYLCDLEYGRRNWSHELLQKVMDVRCKKQK